VWVCVDSFLYESRWSWLTQFLQTPPE
jgi:hypothetical protein